MAKRLGVSSPTLNGPADDLGGSLTLGRSEVSPLDMATAYATIAAHGMRCYPKPVLTMTSGGKPVSYSRAGQVPAGAQARHRRHRHQPARGRHPDGTAADNGQIGRPAAGKTGTTDNHFDAWFVGYIPQLAAAVWVGDSRSPTLYPLQVTSTTPDGVAGIPIWRPDARGLRW